MGTEIRKVEEKLVYSDPENPWLRLYFDRVEFPDGRPGRYNRIVEGTSNPGVAVLPFSTGGIGFVRQFRYAIEEHVWEIPRGYGDSSDSSREARRELLEETGLEPKKLVALGVIHPNSAVLATRMELFAAECNPEVPKLQVDGREHCEFKWFSIREAMFAVETGEIKDAITLSALLRARLRGLV